MTLPKNLVFRLVFAQSLDALTFLIFYIFIGPGKFSEQNFLILLLVSIGGIWAIPVAKLGLSLLVAYRSQIPVPAKFNNVRIVAISTATASGIVGAGFNFAAIVGSI
jgi:hypothetical protein